MLDAPSSVKDKRGEQPLLACLVHVTSPRGNHFMLTVRVTLIIKPPAPNPKFSNYAGTDPKQYGQKDRG